MSHDVMDTTNQYLYGPINYEDGYGSGIHTITDNATEINLGRNCFYEIQFNNADGYYLMLDGYEAKASTESDANQNAESSVTDATGYFVSAGTVIKTGTHKYRHVLSVKAVDNTAAWIDLRIFKKEKWKAWKDDGSSA